MYQIVSRQFITSSKFHKIQKCLVNYKIKMYQYIIYIILELRNSKTRE